MFILFKWFYVNSQIKDNFLLISIDIKSKTKLHSFKRQFLIIELDSLMKPIGEASPVLLNDFSDSQVNSCKLCDTINIYKSFSNDTFKFDSINHNLLENNFNIIEKNKKEVFSMKYKYKAHEANVKFYYTAIKGSICNGKISKYDSEIMGYHNKIFLITNEIFINENFTKIDFKEINFIDLINLNKCLF